MAAVYGIRSDNKCKHEVVPAENIVTLKVIATDISAGYHTVSTSYLPEHMQNKEFGEVIILGMSRCVKTSNGGYHDVTITNGVDSDAYLRDKYLEYYAANISVNIAGLYGGSILIAYTVADAPPAQILEIDFYITMLLNELVTG